MLSHRMMMNQVIAFLAQLSAWGSNANGVTGLNKTLDMLIPFQTPGTNMLSCSGGESHSLIVKKDGTLWAFGENTNGRTGLNTINGDTIALTQVGTATNWASCSVGFSHSLAVKTNGTLWAFGENTSARTGLNSTSGDTTVPTQVGTATDWKSCSAGDNHSLAIKTNGTLWSFGDGTYGQTGLNSTATAIAPTQVGTATDWASCSAGSSYSLAVKTTGTLWSFGRNLSGRTGLNTTTGTAMVPTQVGTATDWASCSAGGAHSLAIKTTGTLWSFGANSNGKTGLNTTSGSTNIPTQVGTATDWASCSAGSSVGNSHSLAVKTTGTLWAFGGNANGKTGLNVSGNGNAVVPTQVGTDTDWKSCDAGGSHSLAVKTPSDALWAFGSNLNGQTGMNMRSIELVPVPISTDWVSFSAGSLHSLAVQRNGTLWSCGTNAFSRTGLNTINGETLVFTQVGTDTDWASCAAGNVHSLAVKKNGTLWAFGENQSGKTGLNNVLGNTLVPTQVGTDTDWKSCSAGNFHSLATKTTGTLWSFGTNGSGATGLGNLTGTTDIPAQVGTDVDWKSCSAGSDYSLAVKTTGTLWSFGNNQNGRTGLNTITGATAVPTQVGTDTDWATCSGGNSHSLAIKTTGTLWSFGSNTNGKTGLNINTTPDTLVPTQVGTATDWASCSAGGAHSLAVKTTGALWSFGANASGRTGLNTSTADTLVPTQVGTAINWASCSAGGAHSFGSRAM